MARRGGLPVKQLVLDLVILLLVAAAAALAAGWTVSHFDSQAVATANSNASRCHDANQVAAATLARLQADHRADQAALARLRHNAAAAEKRNQTLKEHLRQRAQADHQAIEESPHAHADCAALARLGICPAVAGRLWPPANHRAPATH